MPAFEKDIAWILDNRKIIVSTKLASIVMKYEYIYARVSLDLRETPNRESNRVEV